VRVLLKFDNYYKEVKDENKKEDSSGFKQEKSMAYHKVWFDMQAFPLDM